MKVGMMLILVYCACSVLACNSSSTKTGEPGHISSEKEDGFFITKVKVHTTVISDFDQQILTNGKLEAKQMVVIKFPFNERIRSINIKNGQRVRKSEILAELDKTALQRKWVRMKDAWERSIIALDDKLIDYGYRLADTAHVPVNILKMAKIKSNYMSSWLDLEDTRYEIEQASITAPVDGIIADMEAKPGNYADAYNYRFCSLISTGEMRVTFALLESDIVYLREGMNVLVSGYGGKNKMIKGHLYSINPLVDKDGMIKAQATVSISDNTYLSGMNVKVSVMNTIPAKLSVPKEAVIQKQNHKVVFTVENGTAKLNYVETGPDNEKSVIITSGLKSGQKVIVTNPELLTNGTNVVIE
jgi:RND family efflux transporter MFP subunit